MTRRRAYRTCYMLLRNKVSTTKDLILAPVFGSILVVFQLKTAWWRIGRIGLIVQPGVERESARDDGKFISQHQMEERNVVIGEKPVGVTITTEGVGITVSLANLWIFCFIFMWLPKFFSTWNSRNELFGWKLYFQGIKTSMRVDFKCKTYCAWTWEEKERVETLKI